MPRFDSTQQKRYRPFLDSSINVKDLDRSKLLLEVVPRKQKGSRHTIGCPCGCAEIPTGKTAIFKMGHDARLRGKLIRAHLMEVEVSFVLAGHVSNPLPASKVAERYGWGKYLADAELRREGKNRQVLQNALGSERLVKVGRWQYTGQVVAVYGEDGDKAFDIEYVTKMGEVKRKRVPANEAPTPN